jgi:hypothetical protein
MQSAGPATQTLESWREITLSDATKKLRKNNAFQSETSFHADEYGPREWQTGCSVLVGILSFIRTKTMR